MIYKFTRSYFKNSQRKKFPNIFREKRQQIIQYIVTPILGIKTRWVTEITHVVDKKYFVDEQRFGPYKFWHHKHKFEIIDGGVKIIDILDYSLPFGLIGLFFHPFLVKPKLDEIFKYREKKLIEIFGKL